MNTATLAARKAALLAATACIWAGTARAQDAPPPPQAPEAPESGLDMIVVTATKRSENLQDVPISITALGEETLQNLNVQQFTDYVKYIPSVSFTSLGPGFSQIFFRGISSGEVPNHSASLPVVGTYLDEQPITTIQGALDIHIYDIARVEALAGPQGTLYGASSLAGTLRIISNKPELGRTSGGVDVEVNTVEGGGEGYVAEGFINLPVTDNAAIRLVGWYDRDAGYIDNVFGTRTFPSSGITVDNAARVENDINEVETYGGRASLRIELNDRWTLTPQIMGQIQESDGLFAYDRDIGRLRYSHVDEDSARDSWWQAAMTIEGRIGEWDLTYNFSWLDRRIKTNADYSDYSYFYDRCCSYGAYIADNAGNLIDPSQRIESRPKFTKESHELRVASPADARLRFIGGLFYQRQVNDIEENYIIDNLADPLGVPGTSDNIWLTRQQRIDRDYAIFGEVSYDIIPDKFTLTAGGRLFRYDNTLVGFFGFGLGISGSTGVGGCFGGVDGPVLVEGSPCTNLFRTRSDGTIAPRRADGEDALWRLNATWKFDEDKLGYFTWSRGYRPGGINRRGDRPPYDPDFLTNYEVGFKTSWLDNKLRVNVAAYYQQWEGVQFSFLGPNGLTEIQNGESAEVKGVEADLQLAPMDGLNLGFSFAYNDARLTADLCAIVGTTDCTMPAGLNFATAPDGRRLPHTAEWKGNLSGRYEWAAFGDWTAHIQGNLVFQTDAPNDLRDGDLSVRGVRPGYEIVDGFAGIGNDLWRFEIFAKNIGNDISDTFRYTQCASAVCEKVYAFVNQPRTVGLRVGRRF